MDSENIRTGSKKKESIPEIKALTRTIKSNVANLCVLGAMIGSLVFTCCTIGKSCKSLVNTYNYITTLSASDEESTKNNDEALAELSKNNIVVANVPSSRAQDYYFEDGFLYDKDGNKILLSEDDRNIVF